MGKTTPWVLATGFGALVIAALAWFFGVQPRLDSATEMREQAESEQSRIDTLQIELAALRADFENIEEFREELAALRVQVPTEALLTEVVRELQTHAVAAGVVITNAVSETPRTMAIVSEETVTPPPVEAEDGTLTEQEPTTQVVQKESAHYVVPIRIRTIGDYPQTLAFLNLLQTANPRVILVSDLVVKALDEESASGGLPATMQGWIDVEHTFYVIVLPDSGAVLPEPGPLPVPGEDAPNPFTPLTVSGDIINGISAGAPLTPPVTDGEDDGTDEPGDESSDDGGGEEGEDEG